MRLIKTLSTVALMSLLSACGTPSDGYYDANGNFVPNNPYNRTNHDHAPLPGGTHPPETYNDAYTDRYDDGIHGGRKTVTTTTTYSYDRPGYYNANGYYDTMEGGATVPSDMFPSHGMCRVWFPSRPALNQPPVESCDGIQSRVPAGAYVIYGG